MFDLYIQYLSTSSHSTPQSGLKKKPCFFNPLPGVWKSDETLFITSISSLILSLFMSSLNFAANNKQEPESK